MPETNCFDRRERERKGEGSRTPARCMEKRSVERGWKDVAHRGFVAWRMRSANTHAVSYTPERNIPLGTISESSLDLDTQSQVNDGVDHGHHRPSHGFRASTAAMSTALAMPSLEGARNDHKIIVSSARLRLVGVGRDDVVLQLSGDLTSRAAGAAVRPEAIHAIVGLGAIQLSDTSAVVDLREDHGTLRAAAREGQTAHSQMDLVARPGRRGAHAVLRHLQGSSIGALQDVEEAAAPHNTGFHVSKASEKTRVEG